MYLYYLIQAKDIDDARRMTNKFTEGSVLNWDCEAVSETKIMDVFFYAADEQTSSQQTSRGLKKAVKDFVDSMPEGQKVEISATGVSEKVTIDKTGGGTRIISEPVNNGNKPNGTDEPDTP